MVFSKTTDHITTGLTPGAGRRSDTFCIILVALIAGAIFLSSIGWRANCFGMLWYGHEWCTASTVVFTRNWYREGAVTLRFLQLWNPASAEFPTIASRQPYFSVPPGALLPIWAISRLTALEPSPVMVMAYNSATHLAVTFLLGLTVFVLLRSHQVRRWFALLLALLPVYVYATLPGPMYWQQNVYYSDQAIMLPYLLFVFLEMLRDTLPEGADRRRASVVQSCILFYGALTDWFMFVLAGVVYLKRMAQAEIGWRPWTWLRHTLFYWMPAGIAGVLFLWQMQSVGLLRAFCERILMYTGASPGSSSSFRALAAIFWKRHIPQFYGAAGAPLIYATYAITGMLLLYALVQRLSRRRLDRLVRDILAVVTIVSVAPLLYVSGARNYAAAHEYATHKFGVIIALGACVLAPLLIVLLLRGIVQSMPRLAHIVQGRAVSLVLAALVVVLLAAGAHTYVQSTRRILGMYMGPRWGNPFVGIGTFVGVNTSFRELVVSPSFMIDTKPPQWLCYSMKRVYVTPTLFDLYSKVYATIRDTPCDIAVVLTNAHESIDVGLCQLTGTAYAVKHEGDFSLYRLHKDDVFRLANKFEPERFRLLQLLQHTFRAGWEPNCQYVADLSGVWATNLLAGRYGLFQRGQTHEGEKLHVWGFDCEKALTVYAYTHGSGAIMVPLRLPYNRFKTAVAVTDPLGAMTFTVGLDGTQVWTSGELCHTSTPRIVDLDVRGARLLTLRVDPGADNCGDRGVWIDPWLQPH